MILIYSFMGHSLRADRLTITPDFVISDGTQNSGYVLVSATGGVASWKDISNLAGFKTNHYVGELWGGGVVASVWKENDIEKCLIVSLSDYAYQIYDFDFGGYMRYSSHQWSNISVVGSANSSYDGLSNSNSIIAQPGHLSSSAGYCLSFTNPDFSTGTFSDWYLPSVTEMQELVNNSFKINFSIKKYADDNSKLTGFNYSNFYGSDSNLYVDFLSIYNGGSYWTSTEVMNSGGLKAYSIYLDNSISQSTKSSYFKIRPVRIASDTKIITATQFVKTTSSIYTATLISNISGSGEVFTEIGVCRNGPYSKVTYGFSTEFLNNRGDGSGYGAATDKPAIPLPTISDIKTIATMIYDPAIGIGYGDFTSNLFSLQLASMYSVRAYAITNKGEVKYGEHLIIF